MAFIGKFEHVSNENFKEFVVAIATALKVDPQQAATSAAEGAIIEFTKSGDSYSLIVSGNGKSKTVPFKLGTEFEDSVLGGVKIKVVASVDGNKLTLTSVEDGKSTGSRVYEATDSQILLTITSIDTPIVAKVTYKRL